MSGALFIFGFRIERDGQGYSATDTCRFNRWPKADDFASQHDAERWAIAAHRFKTGQTMTRPHIPRLSELATA